MTYDTDPAQGTNAAVADLLNAERAAARMTFDQLATETGISKRTLLRLLSSKERHIDVAVLAQISAVFNLTPVQVLTMAEERAARVDDLAQRRSEKGTSPALQQRAARKSVTKPKIGDE